MEMISGIDQYPSLEGEGITDFLAGRFGVPHKNILAGNGSTEIIYLLPRALGLRKVAIITPSYHDYYRSTVLANAEPVVRPLSERDAFQPLSFHGLSSILDESASAQSETKAIINTKTRRKT